MKGNAALVDAFVTGVDRLHVFHAINPWRFACRAHSVRQNRGLVWLKVSDNREMFETIVAAAPEFRPQWQRFLPEWQDSETPWYLAMGELAHHVVAAYGQGDTARFRDLFSAVESVLQNDDVEIQNLIHIGLFEAIQNIASHRSFGSDVFRPWLGPRSLVA